MLCSTSQLILSHMHMRAPVLGFLELLLHAWILLRLNLLVLDISFQQN